MYISLFFIGTSSVLGQKDIGDTLKKWNNESVPYVHVEKRATIENSILLDTRAKHEFDVSHLKNALWVGHEAFRSGAVLMKIADKNAPIVVYCSIGVRSEDIGEKLMAMGYTNVTNLYGGIFEWKNKGNAVFDAEGNETEKVHAFDKVWGKLLTKGEKVYGINAERKKNR